MTKYKYSQNVIAIVLLAGSSNRFGQKKPKQYFSIASKPVFYHSINSFCQHDQITKVLPVINPADTNTFQQELIACNLKSHAKLLAHIAGGETRFLSVWSALKHLKNTNYNGKVLIHDAARPFLNMQCISSVINNIKPQTGVIPIIKIYDSVKGYDESTNSITSNMNRNALVRSSTPQGFYFADLYNAYLSSVNSQCNQHTDDAGVFTSQGLTVSGVPINFLDHHKITNIEDYNMLSKTHSKTYKVGQGFDVHKLVEGRKLILCGVEIPYHMGLLGHSDADVATHAIVDAILGALCLGDIGKHFPPTDDKWKGASSKIFLSKMKDLLIDNQAEIINLDTTIICEQPKILPYIDMMKKSISQTLDINQSQVNIKSTTSETLGFTGRKEGIATISIANIIS